MQMFRKKVTAAKLAEQRLAKARAAQVRTAQARRAAFIAGMATAQPTPASLLEAEQLVERVRQAKKAAFLNQYRIAA